MSSTQGQLCAQQTSITSLLATPCIATLCHPPHLHGDTSCPPSTAQFPNTPVAPVTPSWFDAISTFPAACPARMPAPKGSLHHPVPAVAWRGSQQGEGEDEDAHRPCTHTAEATGRSLWKGNLHGASDLGIGLGTAAVGCDTGPGAQAGRRGCPC